MKKNINLLGKSKAIYISKTILTSIFFLLLSIVFFETAISQTSSDSKLSHSLELTVAHLERQYDQQAVEVLSNYFDRNKFFVDVKINAELLDAPTPIQESTPTKPQNLFMPGLPFVPDENLRRITALENEQKRSNIQNTNKVLNLLGMNVYVYADTSLNTKELELMKFITGIAVKINQSRGDLVTVSQLAIPNYTREPEEIKATVVPDQTSFFNLNNITTYLFLLVVVLIITSVIYYNQSRKSSPSEDTNRDSFNFEKSFNNQIPQAQEDNIVNADANRVDKEEIFNTFFNNSAEVASIFRYWLNEEVNGADKVARVIVATDKNVIRTLKKELHPTDYDLLSNSVEAVPVLTTEEKDQILNEFSTMLSKNNKHEDSKEKLNKYSLFKFLEHIPSQHIITLIKEENSLASALMLHYLPEETAAKYVKKLDKETATNIMLHMSMINKLTNEQQQKISSHLFEKSMDLIEAGRREQHGSEHLLPILDKLPVYEQKQYIEDLKATGSIVGTVLEKSFITIDQLPSIDEEIIKNAVKPLNTETVLDLIVGLDEVVIEKILSARPKREQRLIRMELPKLQDYNIKKTEYAKAIFMKSVRKYALHY